MQLYCCYQLSTHVCSHVCEARVCSNKQCSSSSRSGCSCNANTTLQQSQYTHCFSSSSRYKTALHVPAPLKRSLTRVPEPGTHSLRSAGQQCSRHSAACHYVVSLASVSCVHKSLLSMRAALLLCALKQSSMRALCCCCCCCSAVSCSAVRAAVVVQRVVAKPPLRVSAHII
jgi:hypothetical protein